MKRLHRWRIGILIMSLSASVAAEEKTLAGFLNRKILDSDQSLSEVQAFTELRVLRMPTVRSAAEWRRRAERIRRDVLERVVLRGEAARWAKGTTKVEWLETIEGGAGYHIKKLRFEALPGLWIPALLYVPDALAGKVPVVLNVNGHDPKGKAAPYKQIRCINQAKRGMMALNVEWLNMGQLKDSDMEHYRMNQLDLCGTSGLAPFYLSMKRSLDVLLALPNADPKRVAVTGLSGGGWQTIFISSLDTRVTLSNPVAGHSSFLTRVRHFTDLGDSEQTPCDLATVADYHHLNALLAPRPLLLTHNKKDDCCFASDHALPPMLESARPIFRLFGKPDNLGSHVNDDPGTHNYERDNREAFYRWVGEHFYAGDGGFNPQEIPSDGEVKTAEQLHVAVPDGNATFHSLAMQLSVKLPLRPNIPHLPGALASWQKSRRQELREIVHAKDYKVSAESVGNEQADGATATFWKLKLGDDWTVPAVEIARANPIGTVILVGDRGRKTLAAQAARWLDQGHRVVAVDPFYFGESKIAKSDSLFALMVASVGERPLGLQASQLAAVARWSAKDSQPVTLIADGPRSSLFALIAAAIEPRAIGELELHDPLDSLREPIQRNWSVEQKPELFCFGLLEAFDLPQLAALVSPRPVKIVRAE